MYTTMLELAISMVFLFLMLSAASSAIQEIIANMCRWRAKTLEDGIASLLRSKKLKDELYNLPLLQGLCSPDASGKKSQPPSYIASSTFALAVLNWAEKNGIKLDGAPPERESDVPPSPGGPSPLVSTPSSATDEYKDTKKLLQSLLRGAADVEAQRKRLEDWFDNSMDRISGWYKRKSHAFLWIIGGALCLLVNADTISLSKAFWNDQALRAATVTAATEHLKNAPNERRTTQSANSTTQPSSGGTAAGTSNNTAFKRLNDVRAELSKVNIPLGWCWNGNEGELKKECFPIFNDSVRVTAKGKSGTKTYAYWIVSNYADGKSSLAGPFTLDSAPNKLNTENRVVITWPAEGDAKSYDVLRSLTSKRPEGKCNCAVATAVSGLTVEDKSESLHPYQFATWMEEQTPAKPQISVAGKSGAKTYYYWIATNTESGEIDLDGPYPAPNSPDTLSNNNYVVLTWQAVKGAKSYDVLRTSDTKLPTANCTCAVVTAVSKTEISDKSVTLQPYQLTVARAQDAALPDPRLIISGATCPETLAWVWWKLVGLALTALAISQGAPFWFDLLQKAVNLRLAGVAPDEKKEKK